MGTHVQCGHGSASRPRKSLEHNALKAVLQLLGYPSGAARELHAETLNLRFCTTPVASRLPNWLLPAGDLLCDSGFCENPSCGAKRRRRTKKSKVVEVPLRVRS